MKNLIIFALKKNDFPMFVKLWNMQSLYNKKYETELWTDDEGNTLAHYACLHHDNAIWEFAKTQPIDLKHLNHIGKAPIHIFIESSFIKSTSHSKITSSDKFIYFLEYLFKFKFLNLSLREYIWLERGDENSHISISFNKDLLKDLVANGTDINQFRDYPERRELGWTSTDYGAFSIKHILGSPLETLVYLFWEFILYTSVNQKDDKTVEEYNHFFHTLTSLGANGNLIVQGNSNDKDITDAMSSYPTRIVSMFFSKFISKEADYLAIKPFLEDEHTNFTVSDDMGNTVLHTLFARISARKNKFSDEFCQKMIVELCKNKKLTIEALYLKNDFNMSPIELLRGDAGHLRKFLDAFILSEKLDRTLEVKTEVKERRGARKI
jgi:hypothetical protein